MSWIFSNSLPNLMFLDSFYCCLKKICRNTNKHKLGADYTWKLWERYLKNYSTNCPSVLKFYYYLFSYRFLMDSASNPIFPSLCGQLLKNQCLDPLNTFTVFFTSEWRGLPRGFPGKPAPVPVKTRTRSHGYGFSRVRVQVFEFPQLLVRVWVYIPKYNKILQNHINVNR